ncbi:bacteriophage T4 gp5 trimerisation domain-containing protein [Pasteurella sp. PK-2025]|uniref:bacteriophage T4 gp5 trimerisation domain-containing protein n=1 Tax=Pasteurella sp. PK-2025 TaxID=3413133 RepID=UPI003C72399C
MIAILRGEQEILDGELDQPIVTGRTYHANNLPLGALLSAKTPMKLMSQTYKGGGYNGLMMDDALNGQKLDLHAQRDMNTMVLNDRNTNVALSHSETVFENQSIAISGNRNKTVVETEASSVLGNQSTK